MALTRGFEGGYGRFIYFKYHEVNETYFKSVRFGAKSITFTYRCSVSIIKHLPGYLLGNGLLAIIFSLKIWGEEGGSSSTQLSLFTYPFNPSQWFTLKLVLIRGVRVSFLFLMMFVFCWVASGRLTWGSLNRISS